MRYVIRRPQPQYYGSAPPGGRYYYNIREEDIQDGDVVKAKVPEDLEEFFAVIEEFPVTTQIALVHALGREGSSTLKNERGEIHKSFTEWCVVNQDTILEGEADKVIHILDYLTKGGSREDD